MQANLCDAREFGANADEGAHWSEMESGEWGEWTQMLFRLFLLFFIRCYSISNNNRLFANNKDKREKSVVIRNRFLSMYSILVYSCYCCPSPIIYCPFPSKYTLNCALFFLCLFVYPLFSQNHPLRATWGSLNQRTNMMIKCISEFALGSFDCFGQLKPEERVCQYKFNQLFFSSIFFFLTLYMTMGSWHWNRRSGYFFPSFYFTIAHKIMLQCSITNALSSKITIPCFTIMS